MKIISFFKRTFFFSLIVAVPLMFSHCGGSEDYKENEDNENINEGTREENQVRESQGNNTNNKGNASRFEQETGYPEDKVQENTNLTDDKPLELKTDEFQSLDKRILLATLNRQKTLIEYHIRELRNGPENSGNTGTTGNNIQQLKSQLQKLEQAIAKVRNTSEEELDQVAESAQTAIEEAGSLVVSNRMQVQLGF